MAQPITSTMTRPTPNRSRFVACVALLLIAALASTAVARPLQGRLEAIIGSTNLGDAKVAFYVLDLNDGLPRAEQHSTDPMLPASNMKLVTAAAAAVLLDEDFQFSTRLYLQGRSLVVVGDGDPAFGDPKILGAMQMNVDDLLARWVAAAQKAGVERVDRIIIDDRIFDQQRVHPNWPTDQLHLWYCAEVSGLNFNDNCLDIYATPTRIGQSPVIQTRPLDAPVVLTNAARTGRKNAVWPTREPGTNRITVRGEVKHRLTQPIYVTVHDPAMLFGQTLRDRLRAAKIEVGDVQRADDAFALGDATLIAEVRTPLAEILARCNKDSQNLFAESLLKRIGHEATGDPGSWASGSAAVRMFLSKTLGPDAANFVIDDGSGMSRENRLTAQLLCRLLAKMNRMGDVADLYRDSLAVGGRDGTLRTRFGEQRLTGTVHGKSGYINGVIALSGYLVHEDRAYAFSILINDYKKPVYVAKRMMDQMVGEMDKELTGADDEDE